VIPELKRAGLVSLCSKPEDNFMRITWKAAVFVLVGLAAVATLGLNSNAEDKPLFTTDLLPVDCNTFLVSTPKGTTGCAPDSFGTHANLRRDR
jgi:hypothetical protein